MQKRFISSLILALGLAVAALSLVRSTVGQGTDLLVFWKTGRALIEGAAFYNPDVEGGMVFKYPPWIAPFFLPVGLFTFEAAKWVWGVFCVACMGGMFFLLETRLQIQKRVWIPLAVFYWGLWVIHALDGQVIIPLLFLGLWVYTSSRGAFANALLPVTYSAKIFTLFPFSFSLKRFFNLRVIAAAFTLVFALSAFTAIRSFNGDAVQMFKAWGQSASSGAKYLPPGHTRGSKNQSLTSFACRTFEVSPENTRAEVLISLSFFALAFLWFRRKLKSRPELDGFLVGLSLTPIFHPLPWHHLYILTFPLAAYSLQRWALRRETRTWIQTAGLFIALFLLTLSSERAFGLAEALKPIGHFLEWNVGRAWGALLLVIVFTETE